MTATTRSADTLTKVAILEFDHSTLRVFDLVGAEQFYSEVLGEILGGYVEDRSGLTTDELIRARRLGLVMAERERGAGREAPQGTRVMAPHSTVKVAEAVVPMFLHTDHVQEPPPEQLKGTPRMAFGVTAEQLEKAIAVLSRHRVPIQGPVEHPSPHPVARSLYFKDPSGNFLELCCPR